MTSSLSRIAAATLLSLAVFAVPSRAAEVASANLSITGSSLEVAAETTTAPDVPASLQTTFGGRTNDDSAATGFTVLGDLTGPGLDVPLTITAKPGFAFTLPPLHDTGDYTLANIRLADAAGRFLQQAVPASSVIHVAQVLSTQVRVRQLSAAELRERGITIDSRNFDVYGRLVARADFFADPSKALSGDAKGNIIRYLYDVAGRLSQIVDPVGRVTQLHYWADGDSTSGAYPGLLKEIVDWRTRNVSYLYDASGRLTTVLLPHVAAASGVPAEYDFSTDARRPRILYKYATAPSDFSGAVDLGANLASIVDPPEALTTQTARVAFEYGTDAASRDRVVKQTWGTGETASFDYQSPAHVHVTDALQQSTDYDLTPGPIVEIAKISQVVPVAEFASLPVKAPVAGAVQPAPLETSFTYDAASGVLQTVKYPNGRLETILPAALNGIPGTVVDTIREIGGTGHVTSFEYDSDGESPAIPVRMTQSESGGAVTRPTQAPSRTHHKTAAVDGASPSLIGEEALYDDAGRVTSTRTLAAAPAAGDAPSPNPVRETTYEYTADDDRTNLLARGTLKTISIAGTKAITQTLSASGAGAQSHTLDERRGVDALTETDAHDRVAHTTIGTVTDESFGYDAAGRLVYSSRKQNGATIVTKTEYDVVGRAIKTTLQNGASILGTEAPLVATTTYRLADRTVERSDPHVEGQSFAITTTKLDGLGRAIETTRSAGGESITARFAYDRSGSRSFESDTVRNAIARRFDSRGRELESVDSIGVKQTSAWSAWDELSDSTTLDAAGQRIAASHQSFTALGRLRSTADEMEPNGAARISWLTWNDGATIVGTRIGLAASVTAQLSGLARGTQQTLDAQGRVAEVSSGSFTGINDLLAPANTFLKADYGDFDGDQPSTVVSLEKLGGPVTSHISYDALGRAITTTEGDTYTTSMAYDEAGNTTSVTPPGMGARSMQYDARGFLLQETLQDGHTIRYAYDALGNLRERTDQTGEKTKYDVDALGRVTTVTYPDATTEVTDYEPVTGAVRATKNRAGQWRSFVFDGRGAIAEVHNVEQAAAGDTGTMIERRTYDAGGRLQLVANRDGAIEYADLDSLGRPRTTRAYRYKNGSGLTTADVYDVHTQSHVWNEHGERTRWRMPAAGTAAVGSTTPTPWRTFVDEAHDAAGNLTTLTTAASPLLTGIGRGPGRLASRSRAIAGGDPLQSSYGYSDGPAVTPPPPDGMTALPTPPAAPATGLLRAMKTLRGNTPVASIDVTHDAARRIGSIVDSTFGGVGSSFVYDSRGRLQASVIAVDPHAPGAQVTDTLTPADFRSARTAPSRLSASQHALLGNALAASLEVATWNATELAGHRLDVRTSSLDGVPAATTAYQFAGGRRTKEGDWSVAYDEQDRLTSRTNATLGRRIDYVYDPNGRLIGRTARKANGSEWVTEDRPDVLAADSLPPDVTFIWDPITDRLASIAIAGASTAANATPEAGLLRQYVHGDQAYDDPVEVTTSDQVTVRHYLPLIDEAGTGNVSAVLDDHGNLVERVLYADAYGDAPRYLQGPVVQRMTFAAQHTGATLTGVTVSVTLSDPIDPATLDAGVRLATLSSSNAIVSTTAAAPTLLDANTITWFLPTTEWQSLTSNPAAATLEIAVTDQLRTTTWSSNPIAPAPDWTLTLFPGTSAAGSSGSPLRVSHRESLSTLASYAATSTPHTLYEVANLYLAASPTSLTHLFTGFHAAPFVEPATGTAYFRARWYDPGTGTWMTPDPLGDVDSENLYAFAGGDPISHCDPTGFEQRVSKDARFGELGFDLSEIAHDVGDALKRQARAIDRMGRKRKTIEGHDAGLAKWTAETFAGNLVAGLASSIWEMAEDVGRQKGRDVGTKLINSGLNAGGRAAVQFYQADAREQRRMLVNGTVNVVEQLAFARLMKGLAGEKVVPLSIPSEELTLGELLAGHSPNSMIHITPFDAGDFVHGITPGTFWTRLGDVAGLTPHELRVNVVGPAAPGYGPNATLIVIAAPKDAASFVRGAEVGFGFEGEGFIEYTNPKLVAPADTVVVPQGPPLPYAVRPPKIRSNGTKH